MSERKRTLAVDIGGTWIKALVLDHRGRPLGDPDREPTPRPATPRAVFAALRVLGARMPRYDRASVGFPGVVLDGEARTAANLHPAWISLRLVAPLRKALGVPTRVALRDFHDGVRFSRAALAEPELCPEPLPPPSHHQNRNSFLETDDLGLVADFLLDAFFFINLGELAIFLADAYDLDERDFWSIVSASVAAYEQRFPELAERFALFDVRKPAIAVEMLATRRLLPDTELRLHAVGNPLAGL